MQPETLYLGLKVVDWITVAGLISGPILAVLIGILFEGRRKQFENRLQVLRMILNTRHNPSDPIYNAAINLIPLEFNDKKDILTLWREYIKLVNQSASPENQARHQTEIGAAQTSLIFQMQRALGFNLSETEIQTTPYSSDASVKRDKLYLDSLSATIKIATILEAQTKLLQGVGNNSNA